MRKHLQSLPCTFPNQENHRITCTLWGSAWIDVLHTYPLLKKAEKWTTLFGQSRVNSCGQQQTRRRFLRIRVKLEQQSHTRSLNEVSHLTSKHLAQQQEERERNSSADARNPSASTIRVHPEKTNPKNTRMPVLVKHKTRHASYALPAHPDNKVSQNGHKAFAHYACLGLSILERFLLAAM